MRVHKEFVEKGGGGINNTCLPQQTIDNEM